MSAKQHRRDYVSMRDLEVAAITHLVRQRAKKRAGSTDDRVHHQTQHVGLRTVTGSLHTAVLKSSMTPSMTTCATEDSACFLWSVFACASRVCPSVVCGGVGVGCCMVSGPLCCRPVSSLGHVGVVDSVDGSCI